MAFSTLQPVTTTPSAVSSAAPTLKCENGATAIGADGAGGVHERLFGIRHRLH